MLHVDRESLLCDMAETYHIHAVWEYPARYIAMLACGLGEESRIIRRMNHVSYRSTDLMMAYILDGIHHLIWMQSEDGIRGINRPKSVAEQLLGCAEDEGYDSVEEFEEARSAIIEGGAEDGDADW